MVEMLSDCMCCWSRFGSSTTLQSEITNFSWIWSHLSTETPLQPNYLETSVAEQVKMPQLVAYGDQDNKENENATSRNVKAKCNSKWRASVQVYNITIHLIPFS